jgi:hypothetical protein
MGKIRHWTKDEIARLRSLAQKQRVADIAAGLGRSSSSIAVKAHQLRLSLRVRHANDNAKKHNPEPGPAGMANEVTAPAWGY